MSDYGRQPELSGIAVMKPALRRDELVRQLGDVDSETVDLTYHSSRFEHARTIEVVIIGISDPVDSNGKESLVFYRADDDADRKPLTCGIHMIVSVATHPECEGHESLAGEHMGETVFCDGTCR